VSFHVGTEGFLERFGIDRDDDPLSALIDEAAERLSIPSEEDTAFFPLSVCANDIEYEVHLFIGGQDTLDLAARHGHG